MEKNNFSINKSMYWQKVYKYKENYNMPSTCRFDLNKPNATYFSGEVIAGTITLNTSSDKNVRGE